MKKALILGLFAVVTAGFAGSASAGLPCAAYSVCDQTIVVATDPPCVGCANGSANFVWQLDGLDDLIRIIVTVRDCLEDPVPACTVRLDINTPTSGFDSEDELNGAPPPGPKAGSICGTASRTLVTDANGAVAFDITGGGSGRLVLDYTVTAECADPEIELCSVIDTFCVKSTDINGDRIVNFLDTIAYLPQLAGTTGFYSGDFSCDGIVNFLDTICYLPALGGSDACAGFTLPAFEDATNCITTGAS